MTNIPTDTLASTQIAKAPAASATTAPVASDPSDLVTRPVASVDSAVDAAVQPKACCGCCGGGH